MSTLPSLSKHRFIVDADEIRISSTNHDGVDFKFNTGGSTFHVVNSDILTDKALITDTIKDKNLNNILTIDENQKCNIEKNVVFGSSSTIDFNNANVVNIAAGLSGQLSTSAITSNNGFATCDLELDNITTTLNTTKNRTENLTTNKIMVSNNAGILVAGDHAQTALLRNNNTQQQELTGDLNLASGKRIKYNGVALELSSADKLDKDFGNIGSNEIPDSNIPDTVARTSALTSGLSDKASLSGAVFTGDVRLNNLTGDKVLVLASDKDITTSDDLLMTSAERTKISNLASDANGTYATKASPTLSGNITLPTSLHGTGKFLNVDSNGVITSSVPPDTNTQYDNTDFVDLSSAQTVGGVKTFSSIPKIPTSLFGSGKFLSVDSNGVITSSVPPDTNTQYDNTDFVDLSSAQTVGGVKTFSSIPKIPTSLHGTGKFLSVDSNGLITSSEPTGFAKTASANNFTATNNYTGSAVINYFPTGNIQMNREAKIMTNQISSNAIVSNTQIEYCEKQGCSFKDDNETFGGVKTFSANVKLTNLSASKSLVLDDQNIISTSNGLLMTSVEQAKIGNLSDNANSTYAPKASPSFTGDATFAGKIFCGTGDQHGLYFGNDDSKPLIKSFNNNLIIETGDASKFINFKTTQGAGGGTLDSFKINDTYAEIDDNFGLRLNNCDVNKFVKTDGDRKLVSGTIALSDLPSNVLINNIDGALGTAQLILGSEFTFSGGPSGSFVLNIVADTDGDVGTQEPSIHLQNNVGANDGYIRLTGSTETMEIESNKHVLTKCGTDAAHTVKIAHGTSAKITVGTSSVVFAEDTIQSALKDYKKNGVSYGVFEMLALMQPTAWELIDDNGSYVSGFQSHSTFGGSHSLGAASMRYQTYNVGGTAVKHIFLSGAIRKTDTSAITDETNLFTFDSGFRPGRDKFFSASGSGGDFGCIVKIKNDGVISMFKRQEHDNPPASGNLQYVILDGIQFWTDET